MEDSHSHDDAALERLEIAVPAALRPLRCWLVWRLGPPDERGKRPKLPFYVTGTPRKGGQGSPDDVAQLGTYDQAIARLRLGGFAGIGIATLTQFKVVALDFDRCVWGGEVDPVVLNIIDSANTYTELSPSGTGVRMLLWGSMASAKNHDIGDSIGCEVFGSTGFVTITGKLLRDNPVVDLTPAIRAHLVSLLGAQRDTRSRSTQIGELCETDPTFLQLSKLGLVERVFDDGKVSVECPFESEHTTSGGLGDTVYWLPHTGGFASGHFRCLHAHCANRTDADFRRHLGVPDGEDAARTLVQAAAGVPAGGLILSPQELQATAQSTSWLVKGLVPADSIGMLFGASGTFKSFIWLDLACHVLHGIPWCGRKTRRGAVVWIAAEGGAGLWNRLRAWHEAHELDVPPTFGTVVIPLLLDIPAAARALREAIHALPEPPALIVVDTQSQTFQGDENAAAEVAGYYRRIGSELRAPFKASVTVIHHSGHAVSERPRGSSAMLANMDYVLGVFRPAEDAMTATVEVKKQKDGDKAPAIGFALERHVLGLDEDGDEVSSLVAFRHDAVAEIIRASGVRLGKQEQALLDSFGPLTEIGEIELRSAFYERMGGKSDSSRQAWHRALRSLQQKNMIEPTANRVWGKVKHGH